MEEISVRELHFLYERAVPLQLFTATIIWPVFGGLMVLSAFMVGLNFGIQSGSRQILAAALLAVSFTSVIFLVFDLDRGNTGFIKIDQGLMYELKRQISP